MFVHKDVHVLPSLALPLSLILLLVYGSSSLFCSEYCGYFFPFVNSWFFVYCKLSKSEIQF